MEKPARSSTVIDANEAVASVAYRLNEVIALYPITPASPMGEHCDEWSVAHRENLWGVVPEVIEMQSEAGAIGAVHGALQAGALATTFTASQGLLLMIPDMYKIAGELNAFCMHVAARTVATHALSIFCDHSDVMACRATGFAMLGSTSVQEAQDMACIAHAAALCGRVPVLHFFDGFRTSHEINRIKLLSDEELRAMIDDAWVAAHRGRSLSPERPILRGTAHNTDTFFQAREAANPFYDAFPAVIERMMRRFESVTGRSYHPVEYLGVPDALRVVVSMGSSAQTLAETVEWLTTCGEKVGVVMVRQYRPFPVRAFSDAIPVSARNIAVLDRTTEPGCVGEPLYADVATAMMESGREVRVIGGRYGLSGKEFTPAMGARVLEELAEAHPRNHFTIGVTDDVTHRSLTFDPAWIIEPDVTTRAVFHGLGSDGTVSANKVAVKIIGEQTDLHVQCHFVYDSKKAGARTASHLRFGPRPIRSEYLIQRANFLACHQWRLLDRIDIMGETEQGATVLLNASFAPDTVWEQLGREVQASTIGRRIRLYVIDADRIARECGLGRRIGMIMQACFFVLTNVLDRARAIEAIKVSISEAYGRRGEEIVRRNVQAVQRAVQELHEVAIPDAVTAERACPPIVPMDAPDHVRRVTAAMLAGHGDDLPVSAFPPDGTWPTCTARWERRSIAFEIPVWRPEICVQCNGCAFVCPHAAIRAAVYGSDHLLGAPDSFVATDYRAPDHRGLKYTLQVVPEDCTGCGLCVAVCPARDKSDPRFKAINMKPCGDLVARERVNFDYFRSLPPLSRSESPRLDAKASQFLEPLFECSGACAGCGETPYIRLLTQLFGDRLMIANATGCSSIYGGNLPTTPYSTNAQGRGPAWSNSLFEDNAEFGLGFRLALDVRGGSSGDTTVWLVGGDGWAYDIGYGGLDHVLASGRNVNILVLDTEVYSNTGGQQSKATPLGASAKFAIAGKSIHKKDLGLIAMSYGHVYVASVAFGANPNQTVRAMLEAEAYHGPSLVIAYSHCIAHGYDLVHGVEQQERAVGCGVWPLYRFDPRKIAAGEPPLQLDSPPVNGSIHDYMNNEVRFRVVESIDADRYHLLASEAQFQAARRVELYRRLAELHAPPHSIGKQAAVGPTDGGDRCE